MKNIIITAALAASLPAASQATLGIGTGTSSKLRPTMELQIGAEMGAIRIQAGFNAHLSSRVTDPAVFFARAGYGLKLGEMFTLIPAGGCGYELHSFDRPELNRTGLMASAELEKQMRAEGGRWYISAAYINKTALFTLGIKAILR